MPVFAPNIDKPTYAVQSGTVAMNRSKKKIASSTKGRIICSGVKTSTPRDLESGGELVVGS